LLFIIYTINLPVVRPRSCRVIYYFDTPALGRRHQSFGRVIYSFTLSIPYVRCHSVFSDDFNVYRDSFRWWFMDQQWHSVFDNSMHQPRLYFCYRFDASVVNSLTLSITYVGCQSVFIDDVKVYNYRIFAGDLWISCDIAFLTIPCVSHDSIFAIDWMLRSWIHWHCRFHTSAVTQYSLTIIMFNKDSIFADDLWIGSDIAFLTIPCVSQDYIFAIDLMRQSSIHWHYRLHTSGFTRYSLTISRSTVTVFQPAIYGLVAT
jgi:hypothetical protein